uniref:Uncharacterized protein n=1 Tax=Gasterosteus aculeatus aculeatus TaxID=481459 RepID=A0AAQ4RHB9_GASAC
MSSAEMSAAVPNHRRTKPGGIKTVPVSSSGATGPNSQIPGLSQTADETSPVERTSGRRVGIFASDSEYVKLAKGGGHKGLLSHDDDEADDLPVTAYNPPNWFGDESKGMTCCLASGFFNHFPLHDTLRLKFSSITPPFSSVTAICSTCPLAGIFVNNVNRCLILQWPAHASSSNLSSLNVGVSSILQMSPDGVADEMEGLSMTNKYKRTCYEKKAPPVSMTRLLSHGYMADKKKSAENDDDDASSVTSEQTSTTVTEDAGELE